MVRRCAQFTCHVRTCTGVSPPVVRAQAPAAGRRQRLSRDSAGPVCCLILLRALTAHVDSHNDVCTGINKDLSQGAGSGSFGAVVFCWKYFQDIKVNVK